MTREEEIKQAASAYTVSICNECFAKNYCEERNKKCVEYREQAKVFADGANWADEHPKNVWHEPDEEPKKYPILCQDEFSNVWVTDYMEIASHYQSAWEEFTACECIIRWAYVSDLLPKGGDV